jgi:hypothetical protein
VGARDPRAHFPVARALPRAASASLDGNWAQSAPCVSPAFLLISAGAPLDATSAVTFTEKYLLVYEQELKKAKQPDDLIEAMKEQFPSSDLLLAIERSAKANVKH